MISAAGCAWAAGLRARAPASRAKSASRWRKVSRARWDWCCVRASSVQKFIEFTGARSDRLRKGRPPFSCYALVLLSVCAAVARERAGPPVARQQRPARTTHRCTRNARARAQPILPGLSPLGRCGRKRATRAAPELDQSCGARESEPGTFARLQRIDRLAVAQAGRRAPAAQEVDARRPLSLAVRRSGSRGPEGPELGQRRVSLTAAARAPASPASPSQLSGSTAQLAACQVAQSRRPASARSCARPEEQEVHTQRALNRSLKKHQTRLPELGLGRRHVHHQSPAVKKRTSAPACPAPTETARSQPEAR